MARWYDTSVTAFNPAGRLCQVEYAMEAVALAGTCIGILTKHGILLAAERRKTEPLFDDTIYLEKIYKINDDVVCAVAGVIADANVLLNEVRTISERHFKRYSKSIPCEQLVSMLSDIKQAYTQYGGKRPFGVSILYMGWDIHRGYQLYRSDPCGNYSGWKAICVGRNSEAVMALLNQEYEDEMTLKSAQSLALTCLRKSINMGTLLPEKVEMALLTRHFNQTYIHILNSTEIAGLIQEFAEPQCPAPKSD